MQNTQKDDLQKMKVNAMKIRKVRADRNKLHTENSYVQASDRQADKNLCKIFNL